MDAWIQTIEMALGADYVSGSLHLQNGFAILRVSQRVTQG